MKIQPEGMPFLFPPRSGKFKELTLSTCYLVN